MKIEEIKREIAHGDCSAETMELFKTALRRVPKRNRCQHCYTLAASMPPRLYEQAIALIQYGLEEHCEDWFDRLRSYHNLAGILEDRGDYVGAKQAYQEVLKAAESANRPRYRAEYALHLLRVEMHRSNFTYTEDLENYYNDALQADAFSQAFQRNTFYRLLAEIIVFIRKNDMASAKAAFTAARDMLRPDATGALTDLLKRHGIRESAGVTKAARAFLDRIEQMF